jgi:hypothetical protein
LVLDQMLAEAAWAEKRDPKVNAFEVSAADIIN